MSELSRSTQSELNDLQWHWEEAYEIAWNGDIFTAKRKGKPALLLTAESPWELRSLIRDDYGTWADGRGTGRTESASL